MCFHSQKLVFFSVLKIVFSAKDRISSFFQSNKILRNTKPSLCNITKPTGILALRILTLSCWGWISRPGRCRQVPGCFKINILHMIVFDKMIHRTVAGRQLNIAMKSGKMFDNIIYLIGAYSSPRKCEALFMLY